MKEKILTVLAEHPNGMRLREIGGQLHVWHVKLLDIMYELEDAGLITRSEYFDPANMEYYSIWKKI